MDQDRLKKIYQKLLDESYDNRLSITEFRALRTHSYDNEKNEWIPDSYSVFILIKDNNPEQLGLTDIHTRLEGMIGYECIVDFA